MLENDASLEEPDRAYRMHASTITTVFVLFLVATTEMTLEY